NGTMFFTTRSEASEDPEDVARSRETSARAPKSQSRRSLRQMSIPATLTATMPSPKYSGESTGPWYPPTTRKNASLNAPCVETGAGKRKSLVDPTYVLSFKPGWIVPEKWAGPAIANQAGYARSTTDVAKATLNPTMEDRARARSMPAFW